MSKAKSKQKVANVSEDDDECCEEDHDVEKGLTNDSQNEELLSAEDFIASLPPVVRKRVKALKKLQFSSFVSESKFYEEVHLLESKYAERYNALFEKREKIVNGKVEPTDEECDWPSEDEAEEEAEEAKTDGKAKAITEGGAGDEKTTDEKVSGIPEFWLTILKNIEILSEMIEDYDEKILTHLRDIRVTFSSVEPYGFTLHFVFEPNDYFTNTVLTKQYTLRMAPNPEDPLGYEGPEIISCTGCNIDWKAGKNVTIKTVKKVQKHKGRGERRTVTQTVPRDSFFNFFSPPTVKDGEEVDDETEQLLSHDFEVGHFIRERVVPRAVLYFTGEALDEEYGDGDLDDEGEDDEDEEYDEEHDPDYKPKEGEKPDCKQQ